MASVYDEIRAALETKLSQIPNVPAISFENVSFKQEDHDSFLKTSFIPIERRPVDRGTNPMHKYSGILNVMCYIKEGIGVGPADDLANSVVEALNTTTDIPSPNNLDIIVSVEYAEREQGMNSQPHYYVPVNVGWYCYK